MRAKVFIIAVVVLGALTGAQAHDGGGSASCGGAAPAVMSCTTGTHQHTLPAYQTMSVSGSITGTLRTQLDWPADAPMFSSTATCTFSGGNATSCTSSTQPAPPGVPVLHTCAFVGGVSGSGEWSCRVSHDSLPPSTSTSLCTSPYVPGQLGSCAFTLTARPIGMLGTFPGADLSRIRIDVRTQSNVIVASCTALAPVGCAAVHDDPTIPIGTPLLCVVVDQGSGARGGMFGCSAGL